MISIKLIYILEASHACPCVPAVRSLIFGITAGVFAAHGKPLDDLVFIMNMHAQHRALGLELF